MGDMSPDFASKDEEISFWKSLAQDLKIRLAESRDELDEFQENSRELEAELEAQLEQQEARVKDLTGRLARVQTENDQIKEKLEHLQTEAHDQISDLQTGLSEVTGIKEKLSKYIRELEQENDDLERVKRTMVVSLEDFEGRLNQALERNAFLESELDEKETLREMVQRLKDESRDLRQELVIRDRHEPAGQPDNDRSALDSNKLLEEPPDDGVGDAPANGHVTALDGGGPMTPSSRISALNIVGDLLRKVGALESKLASCKSYVKDNPRPAGSAGRELHRAGKPRKTTKIPTQVQR
ncbi:nuclear distribution protein nudE-like 1-B [Pollicipes pollicipes]|uniref:nuclear distribution protein nudE-like 1-B n=1 Tax=Pollicipes pollicipes TaxID=41117 RepID=UPI001884ED90|nr:nuclear distribution protein nudE-like 1-B [Pollicipes pollicipes]